jgi:galactokinase
MPDSHADAAGSDAARRARRARRARLEAALIAAFPDDDAAADGPVEFVGAPGSVNLMGSQTDYNDGLVLTTAIGLETLIAVRRRRDGLVRITPAWAGDPAAFWIDELDPGTPRTNTPRDNWTDLVAGSAWSLREAGIAIGGFDGIVDAGIPQDADLGWAAALEIAAAMALLCGDPWDGAPLVAAPALAALAHRGERDFAGVRREITDQFAAASGRTGRAVLLDCRSLESRNVPIAAGISVVVCVAAAPAPALAATPAAPTPDTLSERRAECGRAVALIAERVPTIASLRDVDGATLRKQRHLLPDALARRVRHVVTENERVVAATSALKAGDTAELGRLFAASHASLRNLYEIGSPELDALVEVALSVPGVFAARMTGSGACTVNLVRDEAAGRLIEAIGERARVYQMGMPDETVGGGPD